MAAGYNRDVDAAIRLRDELTASGGSISVHHGNVGVPGDCDRVIEEVLSAHRRVDFHVDNAGITLDKTVRRMTVDDWHAVMRINISGAFYMIEAVLDHMLERGTGRIVTLNQPRAATSAACSPHRLSPSRSTVAPPRRRDRV